MTDYKKLVEALRICTGKDDSLSCTGCPYHEHYPGSCRYEVLSDAADAIETLQDKFKELGELLDEASEAADVSEMRVEELQAEVDALKAELPKQRNLVEVVRCKDCYWNQIQRFENGKEYCECSRGNSRINNGDWFCPEGEKMEVQDEGAGSM